MDYLILRLGILYQIMFSVYDIFIIKKSYYLSYNSGIFFFIEEFQWFLIELSVLPDKNLAISAHLLPNALCDKKSSHY
jgi:hypothetical protein